MKKRRSVLVCPLHSRVSSIMADNTVGWAEMAANWNGAYTKFDPKAWIPAVHELAVGAVEAHGFDIDWTDSNLVGRIYQAGLSSAAIDLHEEEGAAEAPASAPT